MDKLNYILNEEVQVISTTPMPSTKGIIISPILAQALVQFTEVQVVADLTRAVCTWQCLPGYEEKVRDQLNLVKSEIRGRIAELIRIKFMPKLEFRFNEKTVRLEKMDSILDDISLDPLMQKFKDLKEVEVEEISSKKKKPKAQLPKIPNYPRKVFNTQTKKSTPDSLFPFIPLPEE